MIYSLGPLKRLLALIVLMLGSGFVGAQDSLRIVTDPWPPYAYEHEGKAVGIDVEVAMAVLKKIGVAAEIEFLPWKRCLGLMKKKDADIILAASITEERKTFLFYPQEPVSIGTTVFFAKKESGMVLNSIDDIDQKRIGAILGYRYCEELDNHPSVLNASRVGSLDQSFNMLLRDRIDLVIASKDVGNYRVNKMGLFEEVRPLMGKEFCEGGNYLAFAKKPGYQELAEKFSEALIAFKRTEHYREIMEKYRLKPY